MRKLTLIATALLSLSLMASPAFADHGYYGHGHGGGGGGGWGGLAVFGVLTGAIIASEIASNPQPVYVQPQPVYAAPYAVRPVYEEQYPIAQPSPPPPSANNWYFCQSSAMYYPYTQACPEGWRAVPARPQ